MFKLRSINKALFAVMVATILPLNISQASAAVPHVNLCTAGNYLMLGSVLTNGASTRITSSVPGAIVGAASPFELLALVGSEAGVTNESDFAAHTAAMMNLGRAIDAVTTLSTSGRNLVTAELSTDRSDSLALGSYRPGIYVATNALNVVAGATITLDAGGDPDANFYFISGRALTLGAGVIINLVNGAKAENVYWVAGIFSGDMTLGASSVLHGNFLVNGAATVGAGVHLTGRLLARGAITLGASSHIYGISANTGCLGTTTTPTPVAVPTLTPGVVPGVVATFLGGNFVPGISIGTTTIGATAGNDGTIASLSPTGTVPNGTQINYITYKYVPIGTATVPSIIGLTPTAAITALGSNFIRGNSTGSIQSGATPENNGTIASQSLTGTQAIGSTITYTTFNYIAALSPEVSALSIFFSDTTLVDGRVGDPYLDFVEAKSLSGNVLTGKSILYSISGNLPLGLIFNPGSGYVSGAISKDAPAGIYSFVISAFTSGYPTQQMAFNIRVSASISPTAPAIVVPAAIQSILFTDTTLVDGRLGKTYADYVMAKTFIGNSLSNQKVSYSLTGVLPEGLRFSSTTGYVSGIVSAAAALGVYRFDVSAFSTGYPTQVLQFEIAVVSNTPPTPIATPLPAPTATPAPAPLLGVPTGLTTAPKMLLMSTIWFDSGKSQLTPAAKMTLNSLLITLRGSSYKSVLVNGFTDAVNGQDHLVLSLARAKAVRTYLLERNFVIKVSVNGLGLAESSKYSNSSLQASRKAEIWVA